MTGLARLGILLICVLAPIVRPLPSSAATWTTCNGAPISWSGGNVTLKFLPISFPQGNIWRKQFEASADSWNHVAGSGLTFSLTDDTDNNWSHGNSVSEVYWYNLDDPSVLAFTTTRYTCYWLFGWHRHLDEADVMFDLADPWSTSYSYSSVAYSPYSFEGVALHELGHALGLDHESSRLATMNPYYPNGAPLTEQLRWEPHADDRFGARILYNAPTSVRDLAVSAFHLSNFTGGTYLNSAYPQTVAGGGNFTVSYTIENLGETAENFNIAFYLSKNRYITTSDLLIGQGFGGYAPAGSEGTFTRTLQVPSSLSAGTYYVGYIIDYDNQVPESERWVEYPASTLAGFPLYPANYFRNNHISVGGNINVTGAPANPDYHVSTEVLWDDVHVSTFGWTPSYVYIAVGPVLQSSQISYGSCLTSLGIGSATIALYPFTPSSLTVLDFDASAPVITSFLSGGTIAIYPYPFSAPPNYIQAFALAPNGCFVGSAPVRFRRPFDP